MTTRCVGAALLLAVLLVACTTEPPPPPDQGVSVESSPTVDALDADEEALVALLGALRATTAALRSELEAAATGDADALARAGTLLAADLEAARDPAVARAAADDDADPGDATSDPGVDVTGDDGGAADGSDDSSTPAADPGALAPLLPGPVVSRSTTVSYGDLLTTTLTAARSAGSAGEPVARFLETPLAGDLGAWQRSPSDMLALIGEAGTTTDIDQAATAVIALDGEAPRALAWVVHGLETSTPADEAAARALAHLAVIELALEDLQ